MYIIPMAWLYVALMMAVAEATNTNGTVLGGLITFVLYGLGPVLLVVYLMGSPARRNAIKVSEAKEAALAASASTEAMPDSAPPQAAHQPSVRQESAQPDAGSHAPAAAQGHGVAPVRKEP